MDIREVLGKRRLFLDGGTGTSLQKMGLKAGERPETWNLLHPERIESLHRAYLDAGADIIYTNTFGANRLKYPEGGEFALEEVVRSAVNIAKSAQKACGREDSSWVALDIGPSGKLLKPLGDLDFEDAVALFAEVVSCGAQAGADLVVIETMGDSYELKAAVLQDVVMLKLLGMKPVLSHGGGPGINKMLEKLEIPVQFINGLRYTSEDIMRVVEAVLIGQVNSELVGRINAIGGEAVGLSGISANIYKCVQRSEELGFVGDVVEVNAAPVQAMLDAGYIPVVAPVGTDGKGNSFNINGDTAAGKLASALGAEKLMLLTDIEGLCNDIKLRDVISYLNIADVQGLKDQGTIAGGMIPKVDCCVQAIEEGVTNVHIIDGRKPHSILYEAFTDEGIGTTVGKDVPSVGIKWK